MLDWMSMEGGDMVFWGDDLIGEIDWNDLLAWEPQEEAEAPVLGDSSASSSSSPSNPNIWIDEIENLLMKDDDEDASANDKGDCCENLLAEILVSSPSETAAASTDKVSSDAKPTNSEKDLDNDADDDDPLSKKRRR